MKGHVVAEIFDDVPAVRSHPEHVWPGVGKDEDVRVPLGDLDITLVFARHKEAVLGILTGPPNKTYVLCECVKPHIWCMGGTVRRAGGSGQQAGGMAVSSTDRLCRNRPMCLQNAYKRTGVMCSDWIAIWGWCDVTYLLDHVSINNDQFTTAVLFYLVGVFKPRPPTICNRSASGEFLDRC